MLHYIFRFAIVINSRQNVRYVRTMEALNCFFVFVIFGPLILYVFKCYFHECKNQLINFCKNAS